MTKEKKILICLFIIIIFISNIFVFKSIMPLIKEQKNSLQQSKIWEKLSETSKEELEFIEAEKLLKSLLKKNKTMIEEYNSILNENEENMILLFDLINTWSPALNFGGYRSGVGMSIYPLHFPPEDYYMFQQMIISFNPGEEMLEYNIFFTKNFDDINIERYSLFIKGIFGVNISAEKLQKAMVICTDEIDLITQESQFDYELYNNNDILIKMVAMEDVTGDKYIAIYSKYTPSKY